MRKVTGSKSTDENPQCERMLFETGLEVRAHSGEVIVAVLAWEGWGKSPSDMVINVGESYGLILT